MIYEPMEVKTEKKNWKGAGWYGIDMTIDNFPYTTYSYLGNGNEMPRPNVPGISYVRWYDKPPAKMR